MKTTGTYIIYVSLALVLGIVLSLGVNWMTYKPQPMQVQLAQYQPSVVPAPAIQTLAPQMIEGSSAEQAMKANRSEDPFAPAPAPVIVTTAPLPSITPVHTEIQPTETVAVRSNLCATQGAMAEKTDVLLTYFQIVFIIVTMIFTLGMFRLETSGVLPLVIAFLVGGFMLFFIVPTVIQSIMLAMPC